MASTSACLLPTAVAAIGSVTGASKPHADQRGTTTYSVLLSGVSCRSSNSSLCPGASSAVFLRSSSRRAGTGGVIGAIYCFILFMFFPGAQLSMRSNKCYVSFASRTADEYVKRFATNLDLQIAIITVPLISRKERFNRTGKKQNINDLNCARRHLFPIVHSAAVESLSEHEQVCQSWQSWQSCTALLLTVRTPLK